MPYTVRRPRKRRSAAVTGPTALLGALCAAAAGLGTASAIAAPRAPARPVPPARPARVPAATPTALGKGTSCSVPVLTQAFLAADDYNFYTPVPGQGATGFDGGGWTLTGGARVVTAQLSDGSSASVLDLPGRSKAVSPAFCVTSSYQTARAMVRDVVGSGAVSFAVSYEGTPSWSRPKVTGQLAAQGTAWTLSDPVAMQPSGTSGWQIVKLTLIPVGRHTELALDNLDIDPYARG